MKRFVVTGFAVFALALAGANFITQDEALVSAALKELKFESQPAERGLIGAPPRFKITKKTLDHLQALMKDGKVIEIEGNGAVKIK
jgi:hypothetical protein